MSFSLQVKKEIIAKKFSPQEENSFLQAFFKFKAKFSHDYREASFIFYDITLTRNFIKHLNHVCPALKTNIKEIKKLEAGRSFYLVCSNTQALQTVWKDLSLWQKNTPFAWRKYQNSINVLRAYIAGIFIAKGSVNDPARSSYHLEMVFQTLALAKTFCQMMVHFNFQFNILKRKDRYFCYLKQILQIIDFLKLIDAVQAVFDIEEKRIYRDIKNNFNRLSNIDIHNKVKTMTTAYQQIQKIKALQGQKLLDQLSVKIKNLALLRLEYPEASFAKLHEAYYEKYHINVSKSTIAHWFAKITNFYQEHLGI